MTVQADINRQDQFKINLSANTGRYSADKGCLSVNSTGRTAKQMKQLNYGWRNILPAEYC